MLSPKENTSLTDAYDNRSKKKDITQSNIYRIFQSWSGHLHLGHNLYAEYHDSSSSDYPDILFTMSLMDQLSKSEKGHNSVKYSQNFTKK